MDNFIAVEHIFQAGAMVHLSSKENSKIVLNNALIDWKSTYGGGGAKKMHKVWQLSSWTCFNAVANLFWLSERLFIMNLYQPDS